MLLPANTNVRFIALAPAMSPRGLHNPLVDGLIKSSPAALFLFFGRKAILPSTIFWQSIMCMGCTNSTLSLRMFRSAIVCPIVRCMYEDLVQLAFQQHFISPEDGFLLPPVLVRERKKSCPLVSNHTLWLFSVGYFSMEVPR